MPRLLREECKRCGLRIVISPRTKDFHQCLSFCCGKRPRHFELKNYHQVTCTGCKREAEMVNSDNFYMLSSLWNNIVENNQPFGYIGPRLFDHDENY